MITNPPKLAGEIAEALGRFGVKLKVATQVKDLGIDGHTCRRTVKVIKSRIANSSSRAVQISKLVKAEPKARALAKTGYRPAAMYGSAAQGLSPTALLKLRATTASLIGCKRLGGCPTTCIRLEFEAKDDPLIFGRMQIFKAWLEVLPHMQDRMHAIAIAWRKTLQHLQEGPRHWARNKGLLGAVQGSLLDLGWTPVEPTSWRNSQGEVFYISELDPQHVQQELEEALNFECWFRAAHHVYGAGAQGGVDFTVMKHSQS